MSNSSSEGSTGTSDTAPQNTKNPGQHSDVIGQANNPDTTLRFKVSSGLKRVLGRELITNDEVAIFELVKNSFDAGARRVTLTFENNAIHVADDGHGMDLEAIKNRWLFVAYSSKRNTVPGSDYREAIVERQHYAGSKGVGRFSSDRLGQELTLQTRPATDPSGEVHRLYINWLAFDANDEAKFDAIGSTYATSADFDLPTGVPKLTHGTIISIGKLQSIWDKERLLRLKRGLSKLINPFGTGIDQFEISIVAPQFFENDRAIKEKAKANSISEEELGSELVNGKVGNFIFKTLESKTTYLSVEILAENNKIVSTLVDRGMEIYSISEDNPYQLLQGAEFKCKLFFLNQSAKATFTRRMGLEPVRFGSVFLFRNEFRVFPVGEEGDDYFGLDRRKGQGYARFLGTRDLIGRIDVSGADKDFQEASSRDQGLIETDAVNELKLCFREHCLKRLERYVVPVNWSMANDKLTDGIDVISTDEGRAKIATAVASLIGSEDVELVRYSQKLIDVLEERSEGFEKSLGALKIIARSSNDAALTSRIEEAERKFHELREREAEARRIADEERKSKEAALARVRQAEQERETAERQTVEIQEELNEERKRSLFLTSLAAVDVETLNNLHHQITIYSNSLQSVVGGLIERITKNQPLPKEQLLLQLESIALYNTRIHAIARFATKANFRLASEYITEDLAEYISSYVSEVSTMFGGHGLKISVTVDGRSAKKKFKPIDLAIVIDNLVSNSKKAGSSKVVFDVKVAQRVLELTVSDDGGGIDPSLVKDDRLFDKGVSKTDGSGLGLFHVRHVLSQMGATIELTSTSGQGTEFRIQVPL